MNNIAEYRKRFDNDTDLKAFVDLLENRLDTKFTFEATAKSYIVSFVSGLGAYQDVIDFIFDIHGKFVKWE